MLKRTVTPCCLPQPAMDAKDCSSHSFMHIATILLWVLIWAWVAADMYTLHKKEAETASENAKVMTRMLEKYILIAPDKNDPLLLESFASSLPPHATLSLIDNEQKLIARFPPKPEQLGMQIPSDHPIFVGLRAGKSEGIISWESLIDGVKRLYYYRSIQGAHQPFIVVLGQETSWVFRVWYQRAMAYAVLCTLVTLISLLSLRGWRSRIKHMATITQRLIRDMEEKSRENKTLLDFIPDPAWMIDTKDNIVAANRAFLGFFKKKEASILGRSFSELIPPGDYEPLAKGRQAILETQAAGLQTIWFTGADKQPHPFEISRVPLFSEAGQLYRIVGIARDLTSRYEAESRKQVISQILDHNSDGLMVLDKDLRIMVANQALRHLTGYSEKELIGHLPDKFLATQFDRRIIRSLIWQMKHSGAWNSEIRVLDKKGTEKPFLCRITSITNEQSQTRNWIVFLNDLSRHHETEERIKRLTIIDSLTGLPNRKGFLDSLDESLTNYSVDALMVLNLNHMGRINDAYGHQAGDFLLQRVASRIRKTLREHDIVGRLGDDNFGVQLVSSNLKNIEQLIKKIMTVIARPILFKEQPITCTACAGICLVSGSHQQADDLLRKADTAMRQAREAGINTYRFFSENLGKTLIQRVKREADLRGALGRQELILYYQPQIDILSGRICGCEALLRWNHPEQGLIMPMEFIQLAEETGFILPIGKWALEEACRQNKAWQDEGYPPIVMAVNLSPVQLRHELLVEHVSSALEQSGLESRWLDLEITESALLSEQMSSVLQALKALGVGLSIDDFGTGYSSLAYLRHFPFNKLKIDRTFIRDLSTNSGAAIVRMVLDMARELSLKTLAEGVETEEQINILTDYQCMEYQGYLYSRPVPAASFTQLLQSINPATAA